MTELSPSQLVHACRRGNPEAWDELLERYGRLIWSVAHRLGANQNEAEEVFQRTWLAILEGIHNLKKPSRVASWVAGTARFQTYRLFAEQCRQRRLASLDQQPDEPEIAPAQDASIAHAQEVEHLYQAMDRLGQRCRQLLDLLFLADPPLDYEGISRRTGLAVGSIGPIRARCLKRLRDAFVSLYQRSPDRDP